MSILGPDALLAASITVEVAWPTDPGSGDAPTWTDITPWVRSLTISRGRQYELDRVEAGTLTAELKNDDGRFDPTNTSSPYYPYVLPLRQVRVRSFYDAVEYPLFWGYAERWPMRWESGVSGRTELTAVDGFAVLAQRTLRSVVAEELLSDDPIGYYPLDDPAGTTTAGNLSGTNLAWIVDSKAGPGTGAFGASGLTPAESGTALELSGAVLGTPDTGSLLQLSSPTRPGPVLTGAGGFSVEFWFKTADPLVTTDRWLFRQHRRSGGTSTVEIGVELNISHHLKVTADGVASAITSSGVVNDDQPHHVVVRLDTDETTLTVFLDGVEIDHQFAASPVSLSGSIVTVGGMVRDYIGPTNLIDLINATFQHVAIYDYPLSTVQVTAHYQAGATGFVGERTDERLERVLNYVGWAGGSALDTGKSTMAAASLAGQTGLAAVQETAEAEDGNAYIDGEGQVVFKERHARYNQATVAVFGDPPGVGELHYAPDSEFDYDLARIYSRVVVSPPVVASATREDGTAIERYLERTLEESPAIDTAEEAVDRANYRLARYKDPHLRMPALTVLPQRDADSWPAALGLDFGNPVEVTRDPSGAPAITTTVLIEAIEHQVDSEFWRATFALSPADINTYWILEDPVLGIIDDVNLVAY